MRIAGTIWPSRYWWRLALLTMSLVPAMMCSFSAAKQGAGRCLRRCFATGSEAACLRLRTTPTRLVLTPR